MREMILLEKDDLRSEIAGILDQKLQPLFSLLNKQQSSSMDQDLLSRKEAARYLNISHTTLWEWTRTGVITGHRVARSVRYKKSELDQALKKIKTRSGE